MTSAVDLFKASGYRDADFITLGKLDDSPGLAVFLGMLGDKQLYLFQRFWFDSASKARLVLSVNLV
jgi:hypothetical protein